jgi:hypothetical protein
MARKRAVDNLSLDRWRSTDAESVLLRVAEHAKQDRSFIPVIDPRTTRWHVSAGGADFEFLCTGNKFFDTRAGAGGGGAVDLVMHLLDMDFKRAVAFLRAEGL